MNNRNLWIGGGAAGVMAGLCYLAAVFVPFPDNQFGTSAGMLVVSGFPIFAIVYAYGFHDFIAAERPSAANDLFRVFAIVAFTTVLAMLIVQLAVVAGVPEMTRGMDPATAKILKRSLRLVDLGLDVAWDMLIGTSLIFWGAAMLRRRGLGIGWALPAVLFGAALIVLNAATFPWPPNTRGLFDIGPFIGTYMLLMAVRLLVLGLRAAVAERPDAGSLRQNASPTVM